MKKTMLAILAALTMVGSAYSYEYITTQWNTPGTNAWHTSGDWADIINTNFINTVTSNSNVGARIDTNSWNIISNETEMATKADAITNEYTITTPDNANRTLNPNVARRVNPMWMYESASVIDEPITGIGTDTSYDTNNIWGKNFSASGASIYYTGLAECTGLVLKTYAAPTTNDTHGVRWNLNIASLYDGQSTNWTGNNSIDITNLAPAGAVTTIGNILAKHHTNSSFVVKVIALTPGGKTFHADQYVLDFYGLAPPSDADQELAQFLIDAGATEE